MAKYIDLEMAITKLTALEVIEPNVTMADVRRLLADMPTADVAPVVHGRWDGNDCTVCKLPWNYNMVQDADDWGYFDPMPDYCPNCAAKMDGGADHV